MTRNELASHARNTLGYSERMTQDLLDAYDLGVRAEREAYAAYSMLGELRSQPAKLLRDNRKNFRRETIDADGKVIAFATLAAIEQARVYNDSIPPFGYFPNKS